MGHMWRFFSGPIYNVLRTRGTIRTQHGLAAAITLDVKQRFYTQRSQRTHEHDEPDRGEQPTGQPGKLPEQPRRSRRVKHG